MPDLAQHPDSPTRASTRAMFGRAAKAEAGSPDLNRPLREIGDAKSELQGNVLDHLATIADGFPADEPSSTAVSISLGLCRQARMSLGLPGEGERG